MAVKIKGKSLSPLFILLCLAFPGLGVQEEPRNWESWLEEVEPIMSRAERSVFQSLSTEEDRARFQKLFWQIRDTVPGTPQNEYLIEYYSRRRYAETRLEGAHTDRGRIHVVLGKPAEIQNFVGSDSVVDCELWIYQGEGRRGLPPLLYLLFYRRDNVGEYKLYYPGLNTSLDILSTSSMRGSVSRAQAYRLIRKSYPELAKATLSVIPDEASGAFPSAPNSSAKVIADVFSLPEKEVEKTYLKGFSAAAGAVEVSYTAKEVSGRGALFLTESEGLHFLSSSLLPDRIQTIKNADGFHTAHLVFLLRVEDREGKTIFQQEREIRLKLDEAKKKAMEERKIVFHDFAPIIDGEFEVSATFTNKTTEEFFTHKEKVSISAATPPAVLGYEMKARNPGSFVPLSLGDHKALADPRLLFGPEDAVEGLLSLPDVPRIVLVPREGDGPEIEVKDFSRRGDFVSFRQPLREVGPGNYDLVVRTPSGEVFRRTIHRISFALAKPLEFERVEPLSSRDNFIFAVGQEYLNQGRADKALEQFGRLPDRLWNASTLPVIARAYYLQKDFARVVELLERESVEKNYAVLLLLGNSCLELKRLEKAAEYFERVRAYGDTAENNRVLGAIYHSLGLREKARVYWDRAKALEKKESR